jgi:hypothetical protein
MKPVIYLRIASVLMLVHAVLHTIGGVFSTAEPGPASIAMAAMKANQFLVMGNTRSYWHFYRGLGLAVSIMLTVEGIAFWMLSSLVKTNGEKLRPILAVFAAGYLALTVNSYFYFFLGPVIAEILIAICLLMAIVTAKQPAAS